MFYVCLLVTFVYSLASLGYTAAPAAAAAAASVPLTCSDVDDRERETEIKLNTLLNVSD